jgi:hypothetical protein
MPVFTCNPLYADLTICVSIYILTCQHYCFYLLSPNHRGGQQWANGQLIEKGAGRDRSLVEGRVV